MTEQESAEYKFALNAFLSKHSIQVLRSYGRDLQLKKPTTQKKQELIADIIAVLCGELKPVRSLRGAPVKHVFENPEIHAYVQLLKEKYTSCPTSSPTPQLEETNAEQNDDGQTPTDGQTSPLAEQIAPFLQEENSGSSIRLTPKQKRLLHQLIDTF